MHKVGRRQAHSAKLHSVHLHSSHSKRRVSLANPPLPLLSRRRPSLVVVAAAPLAVLRLPPPVPLVHSVSLQASHRPPQVQVHSVHSVSSLNRNNSNNSQALSVHLAKRHNSNNLLLVEACLVPLVLLGKLNKSLHLAHLVSNSRNNSAHELMS